MKSLDHMVSILKELKKETGELEKTSVVFDIADDETVTPIVQSESDRLDAYRDRVMATWSKQEKEFTHQPPVEEKIIRLDRKTPSMMFLPLLLTESYMPLRGNHIFYERFNRGIKISSATHYYAKDKPVFIPSGLLARRILIALVSKAVQEKSREINVKSVSELLRDSGLGKSGKQSKRIQKTLFQMFMTQVKMWDYRNVKPGDAPKKIHNGVIFEELDIDVQKSNQEKFSFIPDRVAFDERFYRDVIDGKSLPFLTEDILKASGALEHDVLLWLLNRQTRVSKRSAEFIGYGLLYHQFGQPNQSFKNFKSEFKSLMRKIREKHQRKFEVHKDGLLLSFMPSRVPAKQERRIRR